MDRVSSKEYSQEYHMQIVQNNLQVYYEIEAIDTTFRRQLTSKQRKSKAPWIMLGRKELIHEEYTIWEKLDNKEIPQETAITQITLLMKEYYKE